MACMGDTKKLSDGTVLIAKPRVHRDGGPSGVCIRQFCECYYATGVGCFNVPCRDIHNQPMMWVPQTTVSPNGGDI